MKEIRTYEKCGKKYSCPDGEECWYLSKDYYWDCGEGATRLAKERKEAAAQAREEFIQLLKKQIQFSLEAKGDADARFWDGFKTCAEDTIESLRTSTTNK